MPSLILTDSYPPATIVPPSKDPNEIQLVDSDDDNNEDNDSNDDGEANVHEADNGDANDHTDVGCKDKDGHWENDVDNNDTHSKYRFENYNLGSLFKHPMILNILNNDEMMIINDVNVNEMMTSCDVLSLLLDYLTECRWNNSNNFNVKSNDNDKNNYNKNDFKNSNRYNNSNNINNDKNNKNKRNNKNMITANSNFAQQFSNYICHKIEITNLFHVGIILKGNLQHEILTLQHIVNNRIDSIISINKAELEYYNHRENGYENPSSSSSQPFYYHDDTITSNTSTSSSSAAATTMNKGFNNIEYTKVSKNKKRLKPSTMNNSMQHSVIHSSNYNNNSSSSRYDTFNVYHDKNKDYDDDDSISIIDNSILRALCPYPNSTTTSTVSCNNDNNNNHHHTSSSTTTSSSDLNNYDIGKWGEALVYQYLLMTRGGSRKAGDSGEEKKDTNNSNKLSKICSRSSSSCNSSNSCDVIIHWLNEDIESLAGYDITITNNQLQHSKDYRTYIEVKSTRYINKNSFEISLWEWQFLNSPSQV